MCETGLDFGFDVCLDFGPCLWLDGRAGWDLGSEVSRFDGGEDTAVGQGVEVIDDF